MFTSHLKGAIESSDQGPVGPPHLVPRARASFLPLVLTDNEDIEAICALVHAGRAKAVVQVVANPSGGVPLPGLVVSEITPSGWLALEERKGKP